MLSALTDGSQRELALACSPTALALEEHPVFACLLASVLEQLMELDVGRLTDVVRIAQLGGDWQAVNATWGFE